MNRRNLIRTAMGLPLLAGGLVNGLAFAKSKSGSARTFRSRVRPADPAWPGAARWAKLNTDVGGNLIEVHSPFGSCEADPNGTACLDVVQGIRNPYWIGDQPALTQASGWVDAWTSRPSAFAVAAMSTTDIVAAVNFA